MDEEKAIHDNMGMIVKLAKYFKPRDAAQLDDYIQLGRIGVMKAARKYDPSRNTKFSTYAWWHIKWEIMGFITANSKITTTSLTTDIPAKPKNDALWEIMPANLTKMERRVVILKAQKYTFKQIGQILGDYTRGWTNKLFRSAKVKIQEAHEKT